MSENYNRKVCYNTSFPEVLEQVQSDITFKGYTENKRNPSIKNFQGVLGVCFHGLQYLLTHTGAAFPICSQCPAFVTGALDHVFVLLTHLAAPLVGGTVVYDFTGSVVFLELVSFWAGADNSSSRNNRTVVATASIVQRTFICQRADIFSHTVFLMLYYSLILFSKYELESGILYPI